MLHEWRKHTASLLTLAVIQLVGLGLFAKGFFPYKVYLSGFADVSSIPPWLGDDVPAQTNLIEPEFDRLVLIVIDALRNDFILGDDSGFTFIKSQIENGEAIPFTARATAPTVTMPRIKALTTGTVPSFLDAILNIAESDTSSSLMHHDNWVYQFKNTGNRTIHFFGDDTWIRLFPDTFTKHDGTTSFYVSDTVQVDLNVTRHVNNVFAEQDWDAVILHYLGLDHIGHIGGPSSPLMLPKQREMDQVIEEIFEIVAKQDAYRIKHDTGAKGTLLVVCGDHGMNEAGNHGGSSVGETSAAMVFLSPRFSSRPVLGNPTKVYIEDNRERAYGFPIIDQVDLVPTLAALFAFPIPKNNLGKIIPELLNRRSDTVSLLRALQLNAYQLGNLLTQMMPDLADILNNSMNIDASSSNAVAQLYARAVRLHSSFVHSKDSLPLAKDAIDSYMEFIHHAQSYLAKTASDYNLTEMGMGTFLMLFSTLILTVRAFRTKQDVVIGSCNDTWWINKAFVVVLLSACLGMMFASSFIEEEHCVWFYFMQTLWLLAALQSFRIPSMTFKQQSWLASLCVSQVVLSRIGMTFKEPRGNLSGIEGYSWHFLTFSLTTFVVLGATRIMWGSREMRGISSGANYIQLLCQCVCVLLACITAALVLLYKIRAEDNGMNGSASNWYLNQLSALQFAVQLDHVELGRLIYNYGASCCLTLGGLVYVTRRASIFRFREEETNEPAPDGDISYMDALLYTITLLLILLTKTQYATLFVLYAGQFYLMRLWQRALSSVDQQPPVWVSAAIVTCLSHAAFFMTGHSNSISAVDLSNAYIGVSGYDTVLIGVLTFCSNWSGSLWWALAGWTLLSDNGRKGQDETLWHYVYTQSSFYGLFISTLSIAVTILREHLFIWTVFSPKYLYQMAWTCLFHWCAQVLTGILAVSIYGR